MADLFDTVPAPERAEGPRPLADRLRPARLDDVIDDLRDAMYRFPVDTDLLESLGDAFARSRKLQEALDTYTKAEELLR